MEIVRLPRTAPQQTPDSLNPAINRGRVLYSYDPERLMTPASVLKLVTAATGFRVLGPNYVWPDSVPMIDSADVRLPGLERFNPDLLVEDIEEYMPGLDNLLPDSGQMLIDVMDRTLAESLNLQAETLLRLLTPSCRLDSGLLKVQDYWRMRGLDMESLVMYDGCGISPSDRVTAHFINSLLADMQFDAPFRKAMADIAMEGTVREFLKKTRLSGQGQLKTGTLKNVVAYAGYIRGSDGRTYAVTIFVANNTCKHAEVRKEIEKLLLSLIP
jgi:D-alanyl-D-alanine carboxypeptidase